MRLCQFALLLMCVPSVSVAAERYVAMFAEGNRAEEAEVREWNEPAGQAKIGGRLLADPVNPVRWIIDRQQMMNAAQVAASSPAMYLEFEGGDCLAGEVIAFLEGLENPYETKPPHLLVRPLAEVQPPDVTQPTELRVTIEWVRRIVWSHVAADEFRPGTLWLRTGTPLPFRTLRWNPQGVTVLSSEGVKDFSFSDLAEIHLPKLDPWSAYYEQLAVITPQLNSRVIQCNTTDGSRFTTSIDRFQSRHHGDKNRPDQWYQLIQPAWSLDSLWLRYRSIYRWRFFAPHEIPLSNVVPVQMAHQAVFGRGWDYQRDSNVQRGPLQSSDQEFGWGFGVHGGTELIFDYPVAASAVRTRFGLDRIAETGGCVDVEVLLGDGESVLRQTNLIGSNIVGDLGWKNLPATIPEKRRIVFRTGMAHPGRPAGADPFDIRDVFNWYEPELRLDVAALASEVARRRVARLPGLIGWTLSSNDSATMSVTNVVDNLDPRDPQFRLITRSTDPFYLLSRKVKVGRHDRWLALIGSRFAENSSPTTLQIRIDNRVLGEFDVPIRQSMTDPEPMLVPVESFQGRTVTVEAVVYPTDEKSWVDWRGFAVRPDRPGLLTVFEDDEAFAKLLDRGEGRAMIENEKPYSGDKSLKVKPPAVSNPLISGLNGVICESPQLGQYRFVVFAWKKQTGSRVQIQFANRGRLGDGGFGGAHGVPLSGPGQGLRRTQAIDERGQRFGYCYEQGTVTAQSPFPLWLSGDLPREWQRVQRDLFADFGFFTLTGLSLNSVDGDGALFDHLYLARTNVDLEYASTLLVNPRPAPPQPDGNGVTAIPRKEDYASEISRIAPLFSSLDIPHGLFRQTEQSGQTDVIRTHANAPDKPLVLRAGVILPKDRPMMLDLHATHHPQSDWQLVVRVNGKVVHDQLINQALTLPQRGWATIQVDLSEYAGQKVLLEVLNQSNNWQNEIAYWKRIELIER